MNFALSAVAVVTIIVFVTLAGIWRKSVLSRRRVVELTHLPFWIAGLAAASVAAIDYLVWIVLFVWAPPISNGTFGKAYLSIIVIGTLCSVVGFAAGMLHRTQSEGKKLALTGFLMGALWLIAAAASMPVS